MTRSPALVRPHPRPDTTRGFSLIELVITLTVLGLVSAAIIAVLVTSSAQKKTVANEVNSTSMARAALDMMSRDLRSAGFNIDNNHATPQPPVAYVDSMQILINADLTPYPDTSQVARGIPLAYDPNGSPRPHPLIGSAWTPPSRYRTGAELIRWTLDLNNDGAVDNADQAVADAFEASRTPNPDDFELCREVYGDSTAGIVGNNGGSREPVALIRRPGSGNPPMFRVFLQGDTEAWDWSNGPVPANRLQEISRIDISVVAASASKNMKGRYSTTPLTTSVNSIRNAPNYSFVTYSVSGVVYNDANKNGNKDVAELGVPDAVVTLGGYMSQQTGAAGGYSFAAPPGTYVVKQVPPPNYDVFGPDSFTVTIGPSVVKNFGATARLGGWLALTVWNDLDHDKSVDGVEVGLRSIVVTVVETGETYVTDESGIANVFVPVGTYKISAALPDSFVYSTTNPLVVQMKNLEMKTGKIGMYIMENGKFAGTVFNDIDNDGVLDTGEKGVPDAIVSCTVEDGTFLSTQSDKNGKYVLALPVNDPPKQFAYTVACTPPAGYASTADLTKTGIFLQNGDYKDGNNFPLGSFSITKFDVDEPIAALALSDVIENDWRGTTIGFRRQDLDLLTGSDDGTATKVQLWFNQFEKTPPFKPGAPSSARNLAQPIWTIVTDTLNATAGGVCRPDVIFGSTYAVAGNWGVYYTQDGTGNEGFLGMTPTKYLTSDNGDVTSIVTVPGAAGATPEILVGTRSPSFGYGVIESWTAASHTNPVFTRQQTLPGTGGVPGNFLGKVSGMVLGDFITGLAGNELLVGTQTGYYSGQIMLFKKVLGVWTWAWTATLPTDAVTCVAGIDINDDNRMDIVVGTQTGNNTGRLYWYKNKGGGAPSFEPPDIEAAPGIVTAVAGGEFGGSDKPDVVIGWRDGDTSFGGGLQVWVTNDQLPDFGLDPSGGAVNNWVSSLRVANLNYGVYPSSPNVVKLDDIICAARKSASKSTIVTMVR